MIIKLDGFIQVDVNFGEKNLIVPLNVSTIRHRYLSSFVFSHGKP
jgi:hypothetical protein